jgi:hypothetical protein
MKLPRLEQGLNGLHRRLEREQTLDVHLEMTCPLLRSVAVGLS